MQQDLSEKELIKLIRNGEINYFEIFVNKYTKIVFYYVLKRVRSHQDSQDIVQSAFIKAYKALDKFDTNKAFYPWFFTIVKNEINDFYRKNKSHEELNEEIVHEFLPQDEELDFNLLVGDIKPEYKKVLELYFRDGYSYEDIAKRLGKPLNTVKTLIRRAKEQVAKNYEKNKS